MDELLFEGKLEALLTFHLSDQIFVDCGGGKGLTVEASSSHQDSYLRAFVAGQFGLAECGCT